MKTRMRTKSKTLLTLLALGASALAVSAQNVGGPPPGGPGPRGFHPPPLPLVGALDANHDHVIDAKEIANASAALLTLDKNGDGQLTKNEYLPPMPAHAPKDAPRPALPAIVKALDVNGDGVIDASEIANAPAELRTLDKNGDGQLTPNEFIGHRPGMRPRRADTKCDSSGWANGHPQPPGPPPDEQ